MGAKLWGVILVALAALLLTFVGPWNAKQRSADMKASIEQALSAEGIKANVDMQGHVAKLSGEMPSQSVLDKALSIAKGTRCKTCGDGQSSLLKGKPAVWHKVNHDMTVKAAPPKPKLRTQSPYTFEAVKSDGGGVVLNGFVESAKSKRAVLDAAKSKFTNVTDNTIRIAAGAPNASWDNLLGAKLDDLAQLDNGRLSIEDTQVLLTGLTKNGAVRDSVNTSIVNVPNGYSSAANIIVPELAAANVGEVRSEAFCQSLFDEVKGDNKINFATSKAELRGAQTYDLLNNLASAANQCASFRITVVGHTDSRGDEAYNQWLSESRANSVVDYLVTQDVSADRITARGMGETRPIASNETASGLAANRRIEFIVTQQSE